MTNEQKDALKQELSKYTELANAQKYDEIANLLNEQKEIPNPIEQTTVPKQLSLADIFTTTFQHDPAGTLAATEKFGHLLSITERVVSTNDRQSMFLHAQIFGSVMNQAAKDALYTLLNETELDGNWQENILGDSFAQSIGLKYIKPSDIQYLLNYEDIK